MHKIKYAQWRTIKVNILTYHFLYLKNSKQTIFKDAFEDIGNLYNILREMKI